MIATDQSKFRVAAHPRPPAPTRRRATAFLPHPSSGTRGACGGRHLRHVEAFAEPKSGSPEHPPFPGAFARPLGASEAVFLSRLDWWRGPQRLDFVRDRVAQCPVKRPRMPSVARDGSMPCWTRRPLPVMARRRRAASARWGSRDRAATVRPGPTTEPPRRGLQDCAPRRGSAPRRHVDERAPDPSARAA